MGTKEVEKIAKAMSDRSRLLILQKVAQQHCVGCQEVHQVLSLAQPSVSHHVKVLVDAGLLHSEKSGRNITLSLNKEAVQALIDYLSLLRSGCPKTETDPDTHTHSNG
jgi:ArsR family transcriptional regulator